MSDYGIYIWSSYLVTGFTMALVLGYALYQLKIAKSTLKDFSNDSLTKRRVADDT
jgi:heme exporter protein CcmD